jgi:hypothetical protein
VKVLLDECVDWRLSREIAGHEVRTAGQMGWAAVKNGELLRLAAREFEALITVDRNLAFQQNLEVLPLAIIILNGRTSRLADIKPLVPRLLTTLDALTPNGVYAIG